MLSEPPRRSAGAAAALLSAATLAIGCGSDSGGDVPTSTLAGLAPAETVVYLEATVQPEGGDAAALAALASRFPSGTDLGAQIIESIDTGLAETSGSAEAPTFADDIEPWLGERVGVFLTDVAAGVETGADPSGTVIAETTDAELARTKIEELSSSGADEVSEVEVDGVRLFVSADGEASGVVGDFAVSGPRSAVARAIAVAGGEDGLADRDDFSFNVGEIDGSTALSFAWADTAGVIEQALDPNTAAGFEPGQLDDLISEAGFDSTAPATFALGASEDSVVVNSSIGISDAYEEPDPALLADLPATAFLAADCTSCLKALRVGVDYGIAQSAAEDGFSPEEADDEIRNAYGTTPKELEAALGGAALYVGGGTLPGGVGGALVAEITDPEPVSAALESIQQLLAFASGDQVGPLPPSVPGDLEGFVLSVPAGVVTIASDGERLVVALGEDSLSEAFDPGETIGDSGRLEEAGGQLSGYEPSTIFDLAAALPAIEGALAGDPGLPQVLPYLEAISAVASGNRVDSERLLTRTVLDVR